MVSFDDSGGQISDSLSILFSTVQRPKWRKCLGKIEQNSLVFFTDGDRAVARDVVISDKS